MKEKVKLCRAIGGNDLDAAHLCICSVADWHVSYGLMLHSCDCGHSWREEVAA